MCGIISARIKIQGTRLYEISYPIDLSSSNEQSPHIDLQNLQIIPATVPKLVHLEGTCYMILDEENRITGFQVHYDYCNETPLQID